MVIFIYDQRVWKQLVYPRVSKDRYMISKNGDIFDKNKNVMVKTWLSEKGYCVVELCLDKTYKRPIKLHRIVAFNFLTNMDKELEVNHINGDKKDNRVENLEIISRSENIQHSYKLGLNTPRHGELNGMSKYKEPMIRKICKYIAEGRVLKSYINDIYLDYGVIITKYLVSDIKNKRAWKHVSDEFF